MGFCSVSFYQFRNIENSVISLSDKDIFLVGENGQGKTNFLEAIYLLSIGSSFRTKKDNNIIKNGYKEMSLIAEFIRKEKNQIKFKIEKGKKEIIVDEKTIKDRKELLSNFPCIPFTHDDINFVSGPPSLRRLFLNQTLSLFDLSFVDSLRIYNKIIKYRNIVLKNKKLELVNIYDQKAAEKGIEIQQKRLGLIDNFNNIFSEMYKKVSDSDINLKIKYLPSWKNCTNSDEAYSLLQNNKKRDFSFGTTTTGPHRDKMFFFNDNADFAETASTGQIRLISLVLKAAQAIFIYEKTGILPVLLLDDVLLEIDFNKRKRFLENLPKYEQAFFTFLPDEKLINIKNDGSLYRVDSGKIISQLL